jgi:2',3'-cyclic-nucleotide 2'-phosphodiesterase (5'-nucleotidase family)
MNFLDDLAPLFAVPGNHEFDPEDAGELVKRVRESRFDWLGDNLSLATGEVDVDRRMRRAFTFTSGDKTIGIFALSILPEHGGNDRDYIRFSNGSYAESAERAIRELEAMGVDLIIGLTHLHLGDDLELAKLKARYPKFKFIVGGHEHEPEYHEGDSTSAMVLKGASNARVIWQVDVSFDASGVTVNEQEVEVNDSIPIDTKYQDIPDRWGGRLLEMMPLLPSRVGDAAVRLDGREVAVRNADSNWGIFIADQMRTAFRGPAADLAFINGGSLRIDDFVAEDITWEDIARTFGFSSFVRHLEMRGADFRELLEAGYRGIGPSKGYFPQLSGFRVCVDRNREDFDRIVQMQVPVDGQWQEIEDDRIYTVVAPEYLVDNNDGYDFSKAINISPAGSELKYLVLDAILEAQSKGKKIGAATDPANPRFAQLTAGQDVCFPQ